MAYIGKTPIIGNFLKLDTITTSATTTFNLTSGGVAYYPQTATNCIVSLNGVIQSPISAYTISGSTIVFSDALTTSDVIDFIVVLGDVLSIGTPSDNTVSTAKLASGLVVPYGKGGTGLTTLGTANQVLAVNSGATALEYQSVSSDFVKLLSTSASASSAVSIDGYFTSTYDKYVLYLNGGYMSTANRINFQVNKSGTAQTSSYEMISEYQSNQPTDSANYETTYFHIGYWGSSSTRRNDAIIEIYNPLGTSYAKAFTWTTNGVDGSYALWTAGAGVHNVTSAISGITINNQSGYTFTIDKITLYGIK